MFCLAIARQVQAWISCNPISVPGSAIVWRLPKVNIRVGLKVLSWPKILSNWAAPTFILPGSQWPKSYISVSQIFVYPCSFLPSWSHQLWPLIGRSSSSRGVKNQATGVGHLKIESLNQWMVQITKYANQVNTWVPENPGTELQLPVALKKDDVLWPGRVQSEYVQHFFKSKMKLPYKLRNFIYPS